MNEIMKTIFTHRGLDIDSYIPFIESVKNDVLLDVDTLCGKLHDYFETQQQIVVLPDFDMDGIMSGVIGLAGLAELGFNVALYCPHTDEGYGFSETTIDEIVKQYPSVKCILTCDVGMSCDKGIAYAKSLGLDVFVTDHHLADAESHVAADVIVNPMRNDETYYFKTICGAVVLYKCLMHYSQMYCDRFMQEQINRLIVFAGIGTVSDIMPVFHENRHIIRDSVALSKLIYSEGYSGFVDSISGCDIYRSAFYGLYNVYYAFHEAGKLLLGDGIDEMFYAFYVASTFNSVKRMDGDISRAFGVFFGQQAVEDISYLMDLNTQRKEAIKTYYAQALEEDQPYAPYIYISDAPSGILGLLAASLMKETNTPVFAVRNDNGKFVGSGRAPDWYDAISLCRPQGFTLAGHEHAFGFKSSSEAELQKLYDFLTESVATVAASSDIQSVPDYTIGLHGEGDGLIDIESFRTYTSELSEYAPFGKGFPVPQFVMSFLGSEGSWSVFGKEQQHLSIVFEHGFRVIYWNAAELFYKWQEEFAELFGKHKFVATGRMETTYYGDSANTSIIGEVYAES